LAENGGGGGIDKLE